MEATKQQLTIRGIIAYLASTHDIAANYRTVSSWITKGHLQGIKEHQPILNRDVWMVDADEIDNAVIEGRIPPKAGNPTFRKSE